MSTDITLFTGEDEEEQKQGQGFYFKEVYYYAIKQLELFEQQTYLWWAFMNYVFYDEDDTKYLEGEALGVYELLKDSYNSSL